MSSLAWRNIWTGAIAIVIALILQNSLQNHILKLDTAWVPLPKQGTFEFDPKVFRALSLGHLPSIIDGFWIKSLQDPSLTWVDRGSHAPAYYDLKLASDLDPAFYKVYIYGATTLYIVRDDGLGARLLLKKAEQFMKSGLSEFSQGSEDWIQKFWPNRWAIPFYLGHLSLFDLGDLELAQKYFEDASQIPDAPYYLPSLAKRLETQLGKVQVALRVLWHTKKQVKDVESLSKLQEKENYLRIMEFLLYLESKFNEYKKGKGGHKVWEHFLNENPQWRKDPAGGEVFLEKGNRVRSSTPLKEVFGISL